MSLSTALREYVAACFTGLWIQSHEHDDALAEIAQLCRDQDWRMAAWDIAQGLQIPGQTADTDAGGSDPLAAIQTLSALATPDSSALLVLALSRQSTATQSPWQALCSPTAFLQWSHPVCRSESG